MTPATHGREQKMAPEALGETGIDSVPLIEVHGTTWRRALWLTLLLRIVDDALRKAIFASKEKSALTDSEAIEVVKDIVGLLDDSEAPFQRRAQFAERAVQCGAKSDCQADRYHGQARRYPDNFGILS